MTTPLATESRPQPRAAERILNSARELFYREGIRAVGVDEIVANAGVTKPSLYRSYASKDELAASYLRLYEAEFWERFEAAVDRHPGDGRAQLLDYFEVVSKRAASPDYRGCGLSNAAVEYPDPTTPARRVTEAHKARLRQRLNEITRSMDVADPALLADGLFLLLEGTLVSAQIFRRNGPSANLAAVARLLIDSAARSRHL